MGRIAGLATYGARKKSQSTYTRRISLELWSKRDPVTSRHQTTRITAHTRPSNDATVTIKDNLPICAAQRPGETVTRQRESDSLRPLVRHVWQLHVWRLHDTPYTRRTHAVHTPYKRRNVHVRTQRPPASTVAHTQPHTCRSV